MSDTAGRPSGPVACRARDRRRPGPAGDRPPRAGARAPAAPGRAPVHRGRARVRRASAASRRGTWRCGSAPRRRSPRRSRCATATGTTSRCWAAATGAPGVRLSGRAAARAAELGVEVTISLTHSKGMAGAVAMLDEPPALAGAAARRRADARDRRVGDRDAGQIPSLELMERAGEGLARVVAEHVPAGRIAVVCGKGNNGGDGFVAARLLRQAGRDVDVLALWPRAVAERGRARRCSRGCPARRPVAYDARAARQGARASSTRCSAPARPARRRSRSRARSRTSTAPRGRVIAADIPSGVDASTGEVAGAAVRAAATATFHRAKPGLWIAPGKAHAGAVTVIDIGIPGGAPGEADAGLIARRGAARHAAARRRLDQVQLRQRRDRRRLARPHRRAVHERAGARCARGAGLRHGRRAGDRWRLAFAVRLLEAMLVGAARGRRRALARGARAGAGGGRPRGRGRARPGPRALAGRAGARARAGAARSTCRS